MDNRPHDAMCCTFDLLTTLAFLLIASFPGTDQLLVACSMEKQEPSSVLQGTKPGWSRGMMLGTVFTQEAYTLGVCEI